MNPEFKKHLLKSLIDLEQSLQHAASKEALDARASVILALKSVILFINSISRLESQTLAIPLVRLLSALDGLDKGQQEPLLTPTQFGNRPPEPGNRAVIKAYSVFATDCLMRAPHKEKLDDACKFVAVILINENIPSGGRANTPYWKTVKGWRSDRSRSSEQIADTYNALSNECQYPETMPLGEIKKSLKILLPAVVKRWSTGLG